MKKTKMMKHTKMKSALKNIKMNENKQQENEGTH
jgi:hypothetical protein